MRGQTVYIVNVVSFDFSFTPLFYWICSAPEQIQCSFRTLICVRRLRGPEGVVVVAYFFNATLYRLGFWRSISVGLHSQQSI